MVGGCRTRNDYCTQVVNSSYEEKMTYIYSWEKTSRQPNTLIIRRLSDVRTIYNIYCNNLIDCPAVNWMLKKIPMQYPSRSHTSIRKLLHELLVLKRAVSISIGRLSSKRRILTFEKLKGKRREIAQVWWPMPATQKNFRFWLFWKKTTNKTFQKLKQFYFPIENTFVSQMFSK